MGAEMMPALRDREPRLGTLRIQERLPGSKFAVSTDMMSQYVKYRIQNEVEGAGVLSRMSITQVKNTLIFF